jgi:hypothetical protein
MSGAAPPTINLTGSPGTILIIIKMKNVTMKTMRRPQRSLLIKK